jgi:ribonuclease PH
LALRRLTARDLVPPEALKPPVAAVSVGVVEGDVRLDLCYAEDRDAEVDLNVATTADGRLIEVQGTAEGEPFARQTLDRLLDLAELGIEQIVRQQEKALQSHGHVRAGGQEHPERH